MLAAASPRQNSGMSIHTHTQNTHTHTHTQTHTDTDTHTDTHISDVYLYMAEQEHMLAALGSGNSALAWHIHQCLSSQASVHALHLPHSYVYPDSYAYVHIDIHQCLSSQACVHALRSYFQHRTRTGKCISIYLYVYPGIYDPSAS